MAQSYSLFTPDVKWQMYVPEIALLAVAAVCPVVSWLICPDPAMFARSGSLTVFFAAVAEFVTIGRMNKKHLLNAARAKAGETPWDFSRPARIVGIVAFVVAAVGTLVWGYGDLLFTA